MHIFSAKILVYMLYKNVQSFNNTLTNDIISFEQLGPEIYTSILLPGGVP